MKLKATVIFKEEIYEIRLILLDSDGNIERIQTIAEGGIFGPFYDIHGDDLKRVQIKIEVDETDGTSDSPQTVPNKKTGNGSD